MSEVENLAILIDVVDDFSDELTRLLLLLENVQAVAETVDDITIDVDVRGEHSLDMLMGRLAALESMDLSGLGDIVVGDKSVRRGGGGGTATISARSLDKLADTIADSLDDIAVSATQVADGADEMDDAVRGATAAADAASDSFNILDLRMSDLHNALAKLVPLILVILGALPALIGGLIALGAAAVSAAAALAALTGLGALGFAAAQAGRGNLMEGFSQITSEIGSDFLDAFLPVAKRLVPLFEDAMDGLDKLFQQIANRGDVLVQLSNEARAFGSFLIDFVPDALAAMGKMVDAFSGFFGLIAQGMRDMDLLRGLTRFFAQAQPEFTKFFALLMPILPALANLSIGFLRVTNAIMALIAPFARLAEMFPRATAAIGTFLGALMAAITGLAIYNAVTSMSATVTLPAFLAGIRSAAATMVSHLIPSLSASTASVIGLVTALSIATGGLFVLLGVIGAASSHFIGLKGDIASATEELKAFDSVASGMSGTNPFAHPDVEEGSVSGSSRFGGRGGDVNVTVEGNADKETVRKQVHNASYRLERSRRGGGI